MTGALMEKILYRVYSSKRVGVMLKTISHASVLISVFSYALCLALAFCGDVTFGVKLCVAGAVPFVTVSVIRRLIDAPRPYELYSFYEDAPKNKKGSSFPSRHVFSAFCVSALSAPVSPWLSLAAAMAGIALSVSRVLLGIHFIRDVCAGALIGITSGLLGLAIIVL